MMTPNQLIDAMGDLPDEMIAEAHDETLAHRKRSIWTRWAALAACACLIIGAGRRAEIWNPAVYEQEMADMTDEKLEAEFIKYGF